MASTVSWSEYNGATPTITGSRTEMNLKNIDDSTTAYSSSPITAGNNSFTKYQSAVHAGTYNTLSAASYTMSVAGGSLGTGLTLVGGVKTTYTTPATTSSGDSTVTTSAMTANFNSSSTGIGTGTSTYTTAGGVYVNPLRLQMQTTTSAVPGDTTSETITYTWTES